MSTRRNIRRDAPVRRMHSPAVTTPAATTGTAEPDARRPGMALAVGGVVLLALGAALVGQVVPVADATGGSLWVVLLTGLLTGGLTCLAVQGGLLATTVAQRGPVEGRGTTALAGQAAPIAMFLGAKLVAYTLLGALLGAFGSVVGLTPATRGWLQIAAGLFMLGVAGQLLDLHPVFRRFSLQPPRWLQRRIRQGAKSDSLFAPAALGALTVFIPCGTTQAMMVAAVGSGSPTRGALVLFAFVLGTTPLFFALGYLASRLGSRLQGAFQRVAAVAVALLAALSIWGGLALTGAPVGGATAASPATTVAVAPTAPVALAGTEGGAAPAVQEIVIRADPAAYVPNRVQVKAGQPARLKVVTGQRVGCTSIFTIPSLRIERAIQRNSEVTVDIPTDRPGTIRFTCGMGMYSGTIEVVR